MKGGGWRVWVLTSDLTPHFYDPSVKLSYQLPFTATADYYIEVYILFEIG